MGASGVSGPGRFCRLAVVCALLTTAGAKRGAAEEQSERLCDADAASSRTGVNSLACQLLRKLPPLSDVRVMTLPLSAADDAQQVRFGQQLSAVVASVLGATNAGFAKTSHEVPDAAVRQQGALLLLKPRLHGGRLGVTANAVSMETSFWARARGDQPRVLAHAYVESPLDIELRSYLPPVPLVRPKIVAYSQPLSRANAIACGDVDGDGALDIALTDRQRVLLGYLTSEGYHTTHQARWADLSEVASVPLRETLAALFIGHGALFTSSSDRAKWLELDSQLNVIDAQLGRLAVGPDICAARVAFDAESAIGDCARVAPHPNAPHFEAYDRVVVFDTHEATPTRFTAWRDPVTATLELRVQKGSEDRDHGYRLRFPPIGGQLTIADLNLDGRAELLASSDTRDVARDELHLWQLPQQSIDPPPPPAWSVPVPGGIDALAVCPTDEQGLATVLVVSANQLLVVR